jgi:hypothetical protein
MVENLDRPLALVTLGLQATLFQTVSHFTEHDDRKRGHPTPLLRVERLIERLPRVGEPFEVGCSLSQDIGASMHELDRISVAQSLYRAFLAQFPQPFLCILKASLPVLGPGANCVLYSRPHFLLIRRELQRGFD